MALSYFRSFLYTLSAGAAAACLACALPAPANAALAKSAEVLPRAALAERYYGNDAPWFERNIPFFDCSDPTLKKVYYYRWNLYKSHLKDDGAEGYIVTEFLNDVSWSKMPEQSLNDATAFHIMEGRWLRDRRYLDDYVNYMYQDGGDDRHFSEAIAAAVYQRFLADGNKPEAVKNLAPMQAVYNAWNDHYDAAKGMYYIAPIYDATEYSIASIDASGGSDGFFGGESFRPSINSYMAADALAISKLADLTGDTATATDYAARAAKLRALIEANLWNNGFQQFVDRYQVDNQFVHYWNFIRGRELVGYAPWYFDIPDKSAKYVAAWQHVLNSNQLGGKYGLRTVEPSYQYYMRQYRYDDATKQPECQWNGPAWPFQTTFVLGGMANLLDDYPPQGVVTASNYVGLLKQYARLHFVNGIPDLQENYNPNTGRVIVGLPRSHHYNHSDFNDLVITGLVGLRPRSDNMLEVRPLVPVNPKNPNFIRYFCLQDVPYHGQAITIVYDSDGKRYGRGAGLSIYVNGRERIAHAPLGRKLVPIAPPPAQAPQAAQPVDLAINLAHTGNPIPSASVNDTPESLIPAVDGRVWYWPNVPNYWSNTGSGNAQDWFALDFGHPQPMREVQLYFYSDKTRYQAPRGVTLQTWDGAQWSAIPNVKTARPLPLANGENDYTFPPISAPKVRAVFQNPKSCSIALVEMKVY